MLELPDHVIALQFGHRDGGKLVRTNYGHPDAVIARERIRQAYRQARPGPARRERALKGDDDERRRQPQGESLFGEEVNDE